MTRAPISRRRALGVIALGAAGVAVGTAGWVSGLGAPAGSGGRLQPGTSGQLLAEPAVLASRDGVLEVALTAAPGVPLAGRDTSALGYNATSPGPTLRVAPGDLLRIRLTNHLDTPTNLLTHGLHVSPQGSGDNPFVSIAPGAAFDYSYRIPADTPQARTGITPTITATSLISCSAASRGRFHLQAGLAPEISRWSG